MLNNGHSGSEQRQERQNGIPFEGDEGYLMSVRRLVLRPDQTWRRHEHLVLDLLLRLYPRIPGLLTLGMLPFFLRR